MNSCRFCIGLYERFACWPRSCSSISRPVGGVRYFGLAIGFVIVAGGYGAGWISGGAFNPAVAIGIDVASAGALAISVQSVREVMTFVPSCQSGLNNQCLQSRLRGDPAKIVKESSRSRSGRYAMRHTDVQKTHTFGGMAGQGAYYCFRHTVFEFMGVALADGQPTRKNLFELI